MVYNENTPKQTHKGNYKHVMETKKYLAEEPL